ncbi:hypothetical protein DSO57_1021194 [Entomophthora muscae]|uniref:Uncharacterized protein n=1 Tax=Entomophthora muscae TaxID=34485 RepID=A0ACC2U1U4_9FUNG|nr:hypothetical protein DSO57_1021194 [Entomophthora muscae]
MVNNSGRTKHCHFCSPEQAQPGYIALETKSQDPCPSSKLSTGLKSSKSKEAKSPVVEFTILLILQLWYYCLQNKSTKKNQLWTPKIDTSSSLGTWAWEQELNPNPRFPWAARPVDQRTARQHFSGIEPPQAEAENIGPCSETGQTKEIIASNERSTTVPNRGTEASTISFMNLKSTPVANQELSPERGTGLRPDPMTTTLKQVNQVANLRFLTNERTSRLYVILLPLDPSTHFPLTCLSQCPDEPPMENIKFGGGVLYRPKDPALQIYCHFE